MMSGQMLRAGNITLSVARLDDAYDAKSNDRRALPTTEIMNAKDQSGIWS
ncbi:MAG: hypothetical protein QOH93_1133 [Chloroflexia bacterium]|jgi:hypothetical protein|nr:hypothetical protein [Chloroflexia bacterium]